MKSPKVTTLEVEFSCRRKDPPCSGKKARMYSAQKAALVIQGDIEATSTETAYECLTCGHVYRVTL